MSISMSTTVIFLLLCLLIETAAFLGTRVPIARVSRRVDKVVGATSTTKENQAIFSQTFTDQKNAILFEKMLSPVDGNLAETARQYVNFCDESFSQFLNDKIDRATNEDEQQKLGKIRYEINSARQAKLKEADNLLRDILSAGGAGENFEIKKMEARLMKHMRNSEIDMAFMVILQLNIEDANSANATMAVQIMKHMETLIHEHQDNIVSPPVRLMRMLVRTEDTNVRKQMMRQKLLIGKNAEVAASSSEPAEPLATDTPQCMHIVVEPVKLWGAADVSPDSLRDTIEDVFSQVKLHTKNNHLLRSI